MKAIYYTLIAIVTAAIAWLVAVAVVSVFSGCAWVQHYDESNYNKPACEERQGMCDCKPKTEKEKRNAKDWYGTIDYYDCGCDGVGNCDCRRIETD